MGSASACGMGSNDDHDDLVFAVDSGSSTPPSVSIDAPTNGATVAFTVDVQATASSPVGVARVEFYVDGQLRHSDTAPPWLFSWDTTSATNGTHTLLARAYDVASNTGQSLPVSVNVQNALLGQAVFDPTLRVPACALPGSVCDSGTLLVGRGTLGPEPNRPNTIRGSCGDDNTGSFHLDESNDRLRVVSVDGTPIGPGKTIRIEATVWAWASAGDYLDLYHAVDAMNPAWTRITTLPATKKGSQLLSATLVLPASSQPGAGLQAVRARFRYQGSASACAVGYYTDHDDLVFAAN
jgi:leucyl aminopeptidase